MWSGADLPGLPLDLGPGLGVATTSGRVSPGCKRCLSGPAGSCWHYPHNTRSDPLRNPPNQGKKGPNHHPADPNSPLTSSPARCHPRRTPKTIPAPRWPSPGPARPVLNPTHTSPPLCESRGRRHGPTSWPWPGRTTPPGGPGAPATGPAPATGLARPGTRRIGGKSAPGTTPGRGVHKSGNRGERERHPGLLPTFRQPQLSSCLSPAPSVT
jgi:hypothetical protein